MWKVSLVMGLFLSGLFWGCQKSKEVPLPAKNAEPWYDQNAIRRSPSEDWYQTAMWLAENLPLHPQQCLELTLGERQGTPAIVEVRVLTDKTLSQDHGSAQRGSIGAEVVCYDRNGNIKWREKCWGTEDCGRLIRRCYEEDRCGSATIDFCARVRVFPGRPLVIRSEEEFFERLYGVLRQLRYDHRRSEVAEVELRSSPEFALPQLVRLTVEAEPQIVGLGFDEEALSNEKGVIIFWGCDGARPASTPSVCADAFRNAKGCARGVDFTYYPVGYRPDCEICPPDHPFPPASSRN